MKINENYEFRQSDVQLKRRSLSRLSRNCAGVLNLFTLSLLLVGCVGIPSNAIKLSEVQILHLEKYRDGVQSIIDSHRADAEALIAERDRGYDRLILRGEDFRKELYRLSSHLLSRQMISEQSLRFQESLTESDREVVRMIEQHINRRIDKYNAASSKIEIDVTSFLELKKQNKTDEIREILDSFPSEWSSLKRDVESFMMYEPFDEVRSLVVSRINTINEKASESSPDIDRLGNDLRLLIAKVDNVETALNDIRASRTAFHKKAQDVLEQLDKQLKMLESAGNAVLKTQSDLHGTLRRVKTIEVQSSDILVNVSPLIDSLGETGVLKDKESKALNEIVNSVNDLFKDKEK